MVSNFEICVQSAFETSKQIMSANDPSHDWYHVERVWKNARKLAHEEQRQTNESINFLIVELAALFHDVVDFKYDHKAKCSLEELAHQRLDDFFQQNQIATDVQERIIYIILNISWRKQLEKGYEIDDFIELRIVRDADRLEAIGAIGIARCFSYNGAKGLPIYSPDEAPKENISAQEYNENTVKNKGTAINHIYEKLLLIKDKMSTSSGKLIAQKRHDFLVNYLKHFHDEIDWLEN